MHLNILSLLQKLTMNIHNILHIIKTYNKYVIHQVITFLYHLKLFASSPYGSSKGCLGITLLLSLLTLNSLCLLTLSIQIIVAMNLPKVSVRVGEIACQPEADQNIMCLFLFL